MAEVLRVNSTLTSLDLKNNCLEEGGRQAIAEALRVNSTLTSIDLDNNYVGEGGG